ncbi:hypothetical protein HON71_00810 [Candidatus Woesearchaeota archaeon]|jgi:hypothetical protein|nr:hypothetical protein [Candidatus Woesearchaeota archaeon]
MVKENLFQCKECNFWYKDKEMAEKCEKWCKEHHSCNMEITKFAVKK